MLRSILYWRYFLDLVAFVVVAVCQGAAAWLLLKQAARRRRTILVAVVASYVFLAWGFSLLSASVAAWHPAPVAIWGRALVMVWAALSILLTAAFAISRHLNARMEHRPARRVFLRIAQAALFGAPAAALGYGVFIERFRLRLREQDIHIPGLPQDLHGLRLVQLTDIHLSPFLSERELDRAVAMANETHAHIAFVTGDLISAPSDPLDLCVQRLAALRADAGVFGCLGNHEIYARAEAHAAAKAAAHGIRFLRQEAAELRFGNARLNLAGVDYQRFGSRYLMGAEKLANPEAFNVLLSHNPDVFPVAARQGFALTLAGHTHGGQVRFEILSQDLNVARFFTPYVDGLYRAGQAALFVSRGIGTIGMPARLGAPPEVALIRLWRT